MPSKKPVAVKKPRYVDIRIRFKAEDRDAIAAAAAKRGLGFNLFVRLVSAGTAKLILDSAPVEELIAPFIDADSIVKSRLPRFPAMD
jgi:uncharacterized protein (DUF1778 family)